MESIMETQTVDSAQEEMEKHSESKEKKQPKVVEPQAEEHKRSKEDLKHDKISEANKLSKEAQEKLLNAQGYKYLVSNAYTEMDAFIDMMAKNNGYGTLIEGRGGIGKTSRIIKRLKEADSEVAYNDSFTTPAALFIWLHKHKDFDVVVLDDMADFFNNGKILAMLKGALWDVNGERIVSYNTTKPLQDEFGIYLPSSFSINARLVMITNKLNRENSHVKAILTRVYSCTVDIKHQELMEILKQIAKQKDPHGKISAEERMECYEFLKTNSSAANTDLNIRTLLKVFNFKQYANGNPSNPEIWKQLTLKMLKKDDLVVLVEAILNDKKFQTSEQQIAEFLNSTKGKKGGSRANFYRLKKKYFDDKEESKEEEPQQ